MKIINNIWNIRSKRKPKMKLNTKPGDTDGTAVYRFIDSSNDLKVRANMTKYVRHALKI